MKIRENIKLAKDILLAKTFKHKIPLRVTHNITYRCNLACPFCLLRGKLNESDNSEMNILRIKGMMKEFKEMGTRFWLFSGGEPFLREDLGELITYAKDKMGFYCGVSTNGTLLAEKIKKETSFKQIDFVQISLDGPKEIQDRLRGQGTYDKIILALEVLRELGIKIVIMTLILKDNLNYLRFLINLATQYKANLVFQTIGIHPAGLANIKETLYPLRVEFRKVIEELIEEKKNDRVHLIVSSLNYLKMIRDYWPDIPHNLRCYAGKFFCEVSPSGFVVPCCAKLNSRGDNFNGLIIGFRKAFFQLEDVSKCQDCYYAGPQELNIIFAMFPFRVISLYKNYFHIIQSFLK